MVGMQAIALPRIVTEHDVGAQLADHAGHLAAHDQIAVELAVDVIEEDHQPGVGAAQSPRCLALLALALLGQGGDVGVGIPRSLGSVGADQVVHDAAGVGPLGQGCPASELDVVGMGADRQRRGRHGEVVGERPAR